MTSHSFKSATIPGNRLLPGIHGLRGLAALAVVFFHVAELSGIATPVGFAFIHRDFKYGAHLFFVLSAFSLMYSTERNTHRPGWVSEYFIKRFFRIAPLFYCMLLFLILRQWLAGGTVVDFRTILLNITFAFGFVPSSGLVWGGWTIGVEMIFYVIFPVLLLTIKTSRQALVLMILLSLVSYFARYQLNAEYLRTDPKPRWDWSYFSFISNLYFFAAGIFAYRFGKELKEGIILNVAIPWGACIVLALLLFTELDKGLRKGGRPDLLIWAVGFTALCIWQSLRPCVWIGSKVLEYVGERSYSVYLLHPVIVFFFKKWIVGGYASLLPYIGKYAYFICAFLVLMIVLAVSELTYRFIEVPGIKLGRRYISKHAV